jgi:hypothetical protein
MLDPMRSEGGAMTRTLAGVCSACLVFAAAVALGAAAAQDRTAQPGQPTQGKVWIQNRGAAEAVPVLIQDVSGEAPPIRVQVTGTPTVAIGAPSGLVGAARQQWEYQSVVIAAGQDPAGLLNRSGADGWEATGLGIPVPGGTMVVLKRPR